MGDDADNDAAVDEDETAVAVSNERLRDRDEEAVVASFGCLVLLSFWWLFTFRIASVAFITFDENAVLFKSFEDLAGNNPDKEPQLFRYDIASKQIRQVTANRGNFAAVARQLNLDAEAGFDDNPANDQSALNSFAGAVASGQSANGSVLLVSEFARTTAQANSTGIQIGRNQTVTTLYVCE